MPTENRSSNTEVVSVPRERALQLINLLAGVASAAHWLADNSEDCGDEGIDCQRVDFESLSDALDKCEELPELPDSAYVRDGWLRAADELRALLAKPTEQRQREPAGLIPDGYCLMPRRLTAENGAKALLLGEFKLEVTHECPECLELDEPAEGCEICDGQGEYAQRHTIPWDQIKFIYSEAVKGLALQPHAVL